MKKLILPFLCMLFLGISCSKKDSDTRMDMDTSTSPDSTMMDSYAAPDMDTAAVPGSAATTNTANTRTDSANSK